MAQNPLNNMQASLALTQYFPLAGIYPSNGGGGTEFFLGEIGTFAGNFAPAGASANGQLLSIAQNTAVFSLLGTTYGGNGQTTFALPNLQGNTMVGTGQGLGGLDPETLGERSGSTTVTLSYGQTPANGLNPFGQSQSFDNHQPSLGITYEIATTGVFPSQGGGNPLNTLGMIMAFAGNFEAGGYMICDGRLLSIAQNTALFSILGTTYGGNGVTTFALPDLRGRTIIGASAADPIGSMVGQEEVTLTASQVPNAPNSPAPAAFDNQQPSLAMEYLISLQGIYPSQGGNQDSTTPFLGQIVSFAGTFVPGGWALCNGALLSIAQNQALFSVLGTTYGGNGQTTFALPDLRGKTVIGTSAGITLGTTVGANSTTVTTSELPFPMPRFSGAAVTVGQFGAWTPVDSVQSGGGYQIVWKNGNANQFIVWTTDNNGNFQSQGPVLTGVNYALQSLEPTFGQDLNGDGTVGLVVTTIEAFGGTDLKQVADTYFLYAHGTSTGPQLMMSNAAVTFGQFGSWTAIGAEKSPFGNYLVVWKNGAAPDQYIVWSVDNAGNWIGQSDVLSGASSQLQVLEPGFNQDLGGGGIATRTVIESAGGTTLAKIANTWVLSPTSSALGVQIKMSGAPVTVGQFGNWTAIGAERAWDGNFLTVWKNGGADEYIVWTVDGGGAWVSQSAVLSGASSTIQALEPGFNQDLGGGGIATRTVIESFGTTALARIANTYVVSPTGNALGPQIKMSGAAVTLGQFGNWTPIGAERMGDGTYQVAWKNGGLDQYLSWNIDSNGNFLSQGAVVPGGSWYTQNFENWLLQDLNGDGTTGFVTTNIETIGGTALTKVADSYYFNYGAGGPQLKMNGTYVAQGQFGSWTPLGVEKAANGTYDIAWKNGAANQYIVWETDGGGNFLRFLIDPSSGATSAVQQFEPFLQQDLNGDGVIPIEAFGATKLVQVTNNYRLDPMAVLGGPLLKDNDAIVTLNQYGAWKPIAAEQTATGFGVAWQNGNADQYLVWNTNANANKLAQTAVMSGADASLKAFESAFQQDLNKDGVIGAPASATPDMALFTSYMASAFAGPASEGTGIVNEESSSQPILVKPLG